MYKQTVITKSLIQAHRQCPKRAWLEVSGTVAEQSSSTAMAHRAEGELVHAVARRNIHGAVTVGAKSIKAAAVETTTAVQDGAKVLLEGAFCTGRLAVRADIMVLGQDGWAMTEVKSGASAKDAYMADMAIQMHVVQESGLQVSSVRLCHPDTSAPLSDLEKPQHVLETEDVTPRVMALLPAVGAWVQACAATIDGPEPVVAPGAHCKEPHDCPFAWHCGTVDEELAEDDPLVLPSKADKVGSLILSGVRSIKAMPASAFTNERNALVREAVLAGRAVVRPEFSRLILRAPAPHGYMDFEAASFAMPRHVGLRPYEPVAFQWSLHINDGPFEEPKHAEFLSSDGTDPRRAFVESLLEGTASQRTIFVYSSYERLRLQALAKAFPQHASELNRLIGKLIDLLPVARRAYYHPHMLGSWSIKRILPTLPPKPGVTYEELDGVADGLQAQAAYAEIISANVSPERRAELIEQLLKYCSVDTAGLAHFAAVVCGAGQI